MPYQPLSPKMIVTLSPHLDNGLGQSVTPLCLVTRPVIARMAAILLNWRTVATVTDGSIVKMLQYRARAFAVLS